MIDMKEVIDVKNNVKMVAMLLCGVRYDGHEYLLYSIKRNNKEANIFVSKLVRTSDGYRIQHDFDNGEKEILDRLVQRIISRESVDSLVSDGYSLIQNVELVGVSCFDVHLCYVATVPIHLIHECLNEYGLVHSDNVNGAVAEIVPDRRVFSHGFVGNLFLIAFGILVLIFSVSTIIGVMLRK